MKINFFEDNHKLVAFILGNEKNGFTINGKRYIGKQVFATDRRN